LLVVYPGNTPYSLAPGVRKQRVDLVVTALAGLAQQTLQGDALERVELDQVVVELMSRLRRPA
jgi:hypothetical protein